MILVRVLLETSALWIGTGWCFILIDDVDNWLKFHIEELGWKVFMNLWGPTLTQELSATKGGAP